MAASLRRLAALALLAAIVIPGAVFLRPAINAQLAAPETAAPHLTDRALGHILDRHGPESTAPDASKYAPDTTAATIRAMIAEAIREGRPRPDTNGRSGTLYDYDFARAIGTTIEGRPARSIRVVVAPDGAVITAYPR
ncbi:MAG: hypothetical protein JO010_09965 [Alphaproteobacteria bacterium]|nr:hypothetical protein [Alphaproteobacteria bacterium]